MRNRIIFSVLALSFSGVLSACESTKEQFDFSKRPPDEFAVTKRAPLEMPPEFGLRPTRPGSPRPQEQSPEVQARQAVFGAEAPSEQTEEKTLTEGEAILLQQTGATNINPEIRYIVDAETQALAQEEKPTIDRLLSITGRRYEAPAKVVDPVAETERIKQNKQEGKPITEGKTPTVEDE